MASSSSGGSAVDWCQRNGLAYAQLPRVYESAADGRFESPLIAQSLRGPDDAVLIDALTGSSTSAHIERLRRDGALPPAAEVAVLLRAGPRRVSAGSRRPSG